MPDQKIDKIIPLKSQIILLMSERQICILVEKSYVFILNPADFIRPWVIVFETFIS